MLIQGFSGKIDIGALFHTKVGLGFAFYRELMLVSVPTQTSVTSLVSPGGRADEHCWPMANNDQQEEFVDRCMLNFKER